MMFSGVKGIKISTAVAIKFAVEEVIDSIIADKQFAVMSADEIAQAVHAEVVRVINHDLTASVLRHHISVLRDVK